MVGASGRRAVVVSTGEEKEVIVGAVCDDKYSLDKMKCVEGNTTM